MACMRTSPAQGVMHLSMSKWPLLAAHQRLHVYLGSSHFEKFHATESLAQSVLLMSFLQRSHALWLF